MSGCLRAPPTHHIVAELEEHGGGVGAGGQNEDERRAAVRVRERLGQVERRRFDEALVQALWK